jgi:succinate--hydroxymethylglutarate CoA-transferase
MKKPEGVEIIRELVKRSDVLVENFVSGKLASMGLGYEDCKQLNERLIYASITGMFPHAQFVCAMQKNLMALLQGYGQTGPYRQAAGYDVIIEAEAGLMHMWDIL